MNLRIEGVMIMMPIDYRKNTSEYLSALKSYKNADKILQYMLYGKDKYTYLHGERVSHYCSLISKKMGLSDEINKELNKGAFFHDIGKIMIPHEILKKPAALSDDEKMILQMHPEISAELLKGVRYFRASIPAAKYHHERYDGSGYPCGLAGDQIPLAARVVSVADSYDAMTSDRPYHKHMEKEKALNIMISGKGSQFDPDIVDIFVNIIRGSLCHPLVKTG